MITLVMEKISKEELKELVKEECNYSMSTRDLNILYELVNKNYLKGWLKLLEEDADQGLKELDRRYDNNLSFNPNITREVPQRHYKELFNTMG